MAKQYPDSINGWFFLIIKFGRIMANVIAAM
jgi:hypothetical protein